MPSCYSELLCFAESQRQHATGGANVAAFQEQDTEDLETQGSHSDDDLQFEAQTSGMMTCCTPDCCIKKSATIVSGGSDKRPCCMTLVNADMSLIASQGFCSCWGQLAHLTKL